MKKFGRKTTLNLRYGSDKGSHSVVSDWKGCGFMERLTNIGSNGEIWITDNDETRRFGRKEIAYKKLAKYEDLEKQGLLLRLPCNIGDTVYAIDGKNIQTLKAKNDIALISGRLCIFAENSNYADYICYDDLGKTVFLTQEEAEQKLKEMESK